MTPNFGLDRKIADLKLDYQGVINPVFLLRHPFSPYSWVPWVSSGTTA